MSGYIGSTSRIFNKKKDSEPYTDANQMVWEHVTGRFGKNCAEEAMNHQTDALRGLFNAWMHGSDTQPAQQSQIEARGWFQLTRLKNSRPR
ncbi:MAG: hypothetical protein ABF990_08705 [Acetobacter sp.]|uniref:hypothetical protein n=1 Tax=Acetobacter sp. TaxID=440 RepID=UPI0039EC18B8